MQAFRPQIYLWIWSRFSFRLFSTEDLSKSSVASTVQPLVKTSLIRSLSLFCVHIMSCIAIGSSLCFLFYPKGCTFVCVFVSSLPRIQSLICCPAVFSGSVLALCIPCHSFVFCFFYHALFCSSFSLLPVFCSFVLNPLIM